MKVMQCNNCNGISEVEIRKLTETEKKEIDNNIERKQKLCDNIDEQKNKLSEKLNPFKSKYYGVDFHKIRNEINMDSLKEKSKSIRWDCPICKTVNRFKEET